MQNFIERHFNKIKGVTSCFDRIVLTGTIPGVCFADGMTMHLHKHNIRIFDFTKWAEPLRDLIKDNAESVAADNGLKIDFIRKKNFRKEQSIKQIIEQRGNHPGLVHIFSAMETCSSYEPWHNKQTGKTYIRGAQGRCLHYYFYFIDKALGLCYLRVPTWAPFRLQLYFNGHNQLAAKLDSKNIDYTMLDNAFVDIEDFDRAQKLSDSLSVNQLHRIIDKYATAYCPVITKLKERFHWSIMQAEYATDIVFKKQSDLSCIYEELTRTAIHSVKADNIATFLGRKLHTSYEGEMGNDFSTRIEGTRIKHHMGPVSVKMYDKHKIVLRIETTVNDVTFFKHYRKVEHRDGTLSMKQAPLRKNIYSLPALTELLAASNRRYIDYISAIDDPACANKDIDKISRSKKENGRSFKGFNLFNKDDLKLMQTVLKGEFNISGFTSKLLRKHMSNKTPNQISRMLKRLRIHGLIKKIGKTYKYYLTKMGRRVITAALKTKEMLLIPLLRGSLL